MGGTASTFPRFHDGYPTFSVSNTDCVDICHPSKGNCLNLAKIKIVHQIVEKKKKKKTIDFHLIARFL
ncbi:unnamed protein product [Sphenostylis stenocarpa]|uniref:Uncharacterized protein n=1 Tax=Sphenostylis stenocarpa TaxID=92480 RepID=A0AA86VQB7_9FABA|nr:unnamed protein product [Sphenostylis stenocarpa]